MPHVAPGDYATIIKAGVFDGRKVSPGDRAHVIGLEERWSRKNNKVWVQVDLVGAAGNVYARIKMPSWWLRPRSLLDDIADA